MHIHIRPAEQVVTFTRARTIDTERVRAILIRAAILAEVIRRAAMMRRQGKTFPRP